MSGAGDDSVVPIGAVAEGEPAREVAGRLRGGGRRPPHSAEAELAVLSAMVLDPAAIARVVEVNLAEDDFHLPAHRPLFRAIVALFERRQAVDPLTLREELRRTNTLASAGGDAYLGEVVAAVPTSANVEHHARIVLDYALKRRLIAVGTRIVGDAYERPEEADVLLDESEKRIFEIAERRMREGFVHIHRLLHRTIELIESLGQNPSHVTGVPSGFTDLDKMTAGFQLSDLVIVAGRPSMGKCLAASEEVLLADGRRMPIEDVCRGGEARLLTLGNDWKLRPAEACAFVDDGVKAVFRVTTRLGRTIRTTLSHPFLTVNGWKPLARLAPGERVAVPRRLPVFGAQPLRECEVKLLAYLIGDGSLTGSTPRFTNGNPRLRADFSDAVRQFGGVAAREIVPPTRTAEVRVSVDAERLGRGRREFAERLRSLVRADGRALHAIAVEAGVTPGAAHAWAAGTSAPTESRFAALCAVLDVEPRDLATEGRAAIGRNGRNAVARWLDELGLLGCGASDKHVPEPVFQLPRAQLALFLNRLFATDGWATVLATGQSQLGYASASEKLARDVQHLLLRFGVVAALRRREVRNLETRRPCWQLDVTGRESIEPFLHEIGIFGKEEALARVDAALARRRRQANRDLVPPAVWGRIGRAKGARSWRSVALGHRLGGTGSNLHVGARGLTRGRLQRLAAVVGDAELDRLSQSDVWWDEIVSIESAGVDRVYDLTVPETHNFVASDVCVHNTAFALNVAQNASVRHDVPVAIFSLEMSKDQLVQRMLCSEARIDAQKMRTGALSPKEWQSVVRACDKLQNAKIYIDDTPALGILEMRAKARRLKSEIDLGLIVVDYLQLMEVVGSQGRIENRQQEIALISRSLKALAKELNVPVLALSQLSRAPEQRTDHRPTLSDLRESGGLEQDSDLVLFIYREEVYNPRSEKDRGLAELIVGKHRNGPTGSIMLSFAREFTRFDNHTPRPDF